MSRKKFGKQRKLTTLLKNKKSCEKKPVVMRHLFAWKKTIKVKRKQRKKKGDRDVRHRLAEKKR